MITSPAFDAFLAIALAGRKIALIRIAGTAAIAVARLASGRALLEPVVTRGTGVTRLSNDVLLARAFTGYLVTALTSSSDSSPVTFAN